MIDLQKSGQGLDGYGMLWAQLESLLADERDFIANAAQFSAFLFNQLDDLNWAGFYLNRNEELVLGPFQGQIACVRIPFGRGCAAQQRQHCRPSLLKMCTHFPVTSLVTVRRTASWWCPWSRTVD